MRQKLFHQVFAVMVVIAIFAELAMAIAFGVSLSSGFDDYLAARDREDLAQFAGALEAQLSATPGAVTLDADHMNLGAVLASSGLGLGPDGPPGQPPPPPPPPPGFRRGAPPEPFAARLLIFDAQGRQILGPPPPGATDGGDRRLTRPIRVGGGVLGRIQVIPRRRSPSGVESRFLMVQFESAAGIGIIILMLCALPAWLIAGAATRRLEEIRAATRAVASGDFAVVLPERGAREVADTISNINAMTASLQRLDSARRRWLAEVSHELRTPLAALRGELDALRDGIRHPSKAALESLNEEALRLNALIDDLHLLAMADLDGPICNVTATEAGVLCRDALERFRDTAAARSLTLTLSAPDSPMAVMWDPARMAQVLANVLTNSLRYTDPPGEVHLTLERHGDRARILVEDSAPGPLAEDLPHLFEPLYRGDGHRSRATGGSGLGLSVCQAIVRRHAGTLSAAPSRLGGLLITLDLPMDARGA